MNLNTQFQLKALHDDDCLMSIRTDFPETPESLVGPFTPSIVSSPEPDLPSAHVTFADIASPLKQAAIGPDLTATGEKRRRIPGLPISSSSTDAPCSHPRSFSVDNIMTSVTSAIRPINPSDANEIDKRGQSHITIPTILEEPPTLPEPLIDSPRPWNASTPISHQQPSPMSSFTSTSPALSAIPITTMSEISVADGVLMQGPVLCAKYMKWFSRQASVTEDKQFHHLRLRQTHLRWREFEAALFVDRLELYLVNEFLIRTRRLAHVIYLNKSPSRHINQVKLSLISDIDFSWRLAYQSSEGRTVQFLFSTRSVRQSQEWYMALFRLSTLSPMIPASVDLYIPALNNLQICLPLSNIDFKDGNNNIKIKHVKSTVLNLLDCQGSKPFNWTKNNVRLCWRQRKQETEWISDDDFLICPQLIEQTHTLELRFCPQHQTFRDHTPCPVMEGDLMLATDFRGKKTHTKRPVYAMLEGHLMFLLEPFDAIRLPGDGDGNKSRLSLALLSGTKTFLHAQTKRGFRSVTRLFRPNDCSFMAVAPLDADNECRRRARNIARSFGVIDFTKVVRVRPAKTKSIEDTIHRRSFELHFGKDIFTMWETPTMHMMFEWIHWIHKLLQTLGRQQSRDVVPMIAQARLGFRIERRWRSTLQAGFLYVRHNYGVFKQYFCVLTSDRKLVLYNTCRRKRFTGKPTMWTTYEQFHTIKLDNAYAYTDDAHQHEQSTDHQPPRMYADGTVISSTTSKSNAECAFVIWKMAERHVLATLRDRLSHFKIGHQLGHKGTTWVFLARCPEERSMWMWALQQSLNQAASIFTSTVPKKCTSAPSW